MAARKHHADDPYDRRLLPIARLPEAIVIGCLGLVIFLASPASLGAQEPIFDWPVSKKSYDPVTERWRQQGQEAERLLLAGSGKKL